MYISVYIGWLLFGFFKNFDKSSLAQLQINKKSHLQISDFYFNINACQRMHIFLYFNKTEILNICRYHLIKQRKKT